MIDPDIKLWLDDAATRPRLSDGSIAHVYAVSAITLELDICDYIAEHYATLEHFTQPMLDAISMLRLDRLIGEPVGSA